MEIKTIFKEKLLLILLLFIWVDGYTQMSETAMSKSTLFVKTDTIGRANAVSKDVKNSYFYEYRGNNTASLAAGSAIMNGDLQDPLFEMFFHVAYKRYIIPHVNVNLGYNKFNLAYKDEFNLGYMSFDLNIEGVVFPNKPFTPYIFAGGGLNASNYFEETQAEAQGGLGVEYMVVKGFGLKLFSDYNYVFSDTLDGLEIGATDDAFWRMGLGVNLYFGNSKKYKKNKIRDNQKTIINSNPIIRK